MGFLSKDNVENILNEDYQKKMEAWAKAYPFAAQCMFGNMNQEELVKYWNKISNV